MTSTQRWLLLQSSNALFQAQRVMRLALLWDIFPDPEAALATTRTTTVEFTTWFNAFVSHTLNSAIMPHTADTVSQASRTQLARTMEYYSDMKTTKESRQQKWYFSLRCFRNGRWFPTAEQDIYCRQETSSSPSLQTYNKRTKFLDSKTCLLFP